MCILYDIERIYFTLCCYFTIYLQETTASITEQLPNVGQFLTKLGRKPEILLQGKCKIILQSGQGKPDVCFLQFSLVSITIIPCIIISVYMCVSLINECSTHIKIISLNHNCNTVIDSP